MAAPDTLPARLVELLADEAANPISPEEQLELQRLLAENPGADREQLMMTAGLLQRAMLRADPPAHAALPNALRDRLSGHARTWNAARQTDAHTVTDLNEFRQRRTSKQDDRAEIRTAGPSSLSAAGWYVAAALAVAVVILRITPEPTSGPATAPSAATDVVTPKSQRDALVAQATDLLTVPWSASSEPGYENSRGDVVWSDARQEGYLRISGLPVNDRTRDQYQLWVVDASRDVHPVDGGVFDITSDGELIIPIRAKLALKKPAAFAVTLEQPGGVVVSDGPMLLVAPVDS